MPTATDAVTTLSRCLDQTADVLLAIHPDQLADPTPCTGWNVAQLVAHVVAAPGRFVQVVRGGQPDWSTEPPPAEDTGVTEFRSAADDLIHAWHQAGDDVDTGQVDWQIAEFAVHTWDLARATGQSTELDPEVARRGFAFMSAGLTPDNRGTAFAAEVDVPPDAAPYDRLAAFAGRNPL